MVQDLPPRQKFERGEKVTKHGEMSARLAEVTTGCLSVWAILYGVKVQKGRRSMIGYIMFLLGLNKGV